GPPGNQEKDLLIARRIRGELQQVPGAVDVHLHQVLAAPELNVTVDHTLADRLGLSQRDVAGDLLISLSGSMQTAPNFWLDARKGVQYSVAVQTPQQI